MYMTHTFVMRLDAELARRVMATMNAPGQGYRSLDEFVSVAVLNQLNTEMSVGDTVAAGPDRLELWRVHSLLARPAGDGAATGTVDAVAVSDGLFILTNRLSPLKVATRVLANLRGLVDRLPGGRGWPTLKTLQTTAGHAARALGFELRRLDRLRTATHRDRRWTGYPVGRDERASLDRFTVSFTLTATSTAVSGPLVVLGLAATTKGGRVALTRAGERLRVRCSMGSVPARCPRRSGCCSRGRSVERPANVLLSSSSWSLWVWQTDRKKSSMKGSASPPRSFEGC